MTSTPFTDTLDTLAVITAGIGAIVKEPYFYVLACLLFILSFGVRLGNDGRIDKMLKGIRDKVRR